MFNRRSHLHFGTLRDTVAGSLARIACIVGQSDHGVSLAATGPGIGTTGQGVAGYRGHGKTIQGTI
jgi:hypothetical protein